MCEIVLWMVKEGLTKKMTFEKRSEGVGGANSVTIWGKSHLTSSASYECGSTSSLSEEW